MRTGLILLLVAQPGMISAPLSLLPDAAPQVIFAGEPQVIEARFRNSTPTNAEVPLRFRVFQASSATVQPLGELRPWKTLPVLAGQTVVESVPLTVSVVRAETRFLVRWLDEQGRGVGTTEILAVPPDLLRELDVLAGISPTGVFDLQDRLKPLLRRAGVRFEDLDLAGLEHRRGRLAIVCGPHATGAEAAAVDRALKKCRGAGVNILWFREADPTSPEPAPLCRTSPGAGALLVARAGVLVDLAGSAAGQRTLISLARMTVEPELFEPNPP